MSSAPPISHLAPSADRLPSRARRPLHAAQLHRLMLFGLGAQRTGRPFHEPPAPSDRWSPLPFRRGEGKGEGSTLRSSPGEDRSALATAATEDGSVCSPRFMVEVQAEISVEASHAPGLEKDGPLSLSLSPSEGERVPQAGEGAVHGPDARWREVELTYSASYAG